MTKKGLIDRLTQYPDDIPIKVAVGNEGEDGYEEFDLKDYALTYFDGSPAVYVGTYHKYKFRRNDNCNQHRTTANISSNAVI